ncbi:potassium channel family protein [Clostridium septicum]|uniref:Potassium channel family protein n=1 Tax=Clostridium septicum TaxID=1504 RepID=A0A9N7JJ15_CLOSE|nr:potassium channel family protein [Clostridium septicum]AYE33338.1 potassium transporter [Clostridium septicum]MDU1313626.1 ion channel [Clostridium septicum]QAS61508.1 potassium channel protein [Clostridium septicum]UEC22055.1 potassium channel family protein [Clostridium septicum]USR99912.1 potassium channel family protein [Clostridium septicum]
MTKKEIYNDFIGLISLMASIMLMFQITIDLPYEVLISFYYIDSIVWIIFILDYVLGLILAKRKINYIKTHIIDIMVIITVKTYLRFFKALNITLILNNAIIIKFAEFIRLVILILKFKKSIKKSKKLNRFNYMLILTTIVIVLGAVIISLLEGMSFEDALWWSFVTFTTVGYGDVLLTTSMGRVVAVLLMIFGIGFIGITTSTIAAYIINGGRKKRNMDFKQQTIENIKYKLDNLDKLSDSELEDIYKTLKSLK